MTEPTSRAAAQTELDLWWDALSAVSTGQSYTIAGRQLTRVDVGEIRATIRQLTRLRDDFVDAARTTPTSSGGFKVGVWSGTVS